MRTLKWDGYVRLEDLKTVAPAERRPPLHRQLELLAEVAADLTAALVADAQGIGSGHDVRTADRALIGPRAGS